MYRALIILLFVIFQNSSFAQNNWTLEKCINKAVSESISAEISELNIKQSEISLNGAQHARYPNLNANTNVQWNFGRSIDPTTNEFLSQTFFSNNLSLSSNVVLFDGGRIKKTIEQSEILNKAAQSDHKQLIRDISLQVSTLYLNSIFSLENKRISENQLELSKEQLNQVQVLIENGALPKNESLEIEAQIARDQQNIINAENTYSNSLNQLKQLLRLSQSQEISLVIPNVKNQETTDPFVITFDEVYQAALSNQHNIIAGEYRLQGSEVQKQIAESGMYPTLSAGGSLGTNFSNRGQTFVGEQFDLVENNVILNGEPAILGINQLSILTEKASFGDQYNENLSYGFGVSLGIPIYNNNSVKNNIHRAELGILQDRLNNEQLKEDLKLTVQNALADAQASKLSLSASDRAVEAQRASFGNSEKKYKLGAINTFEYLSARNLLDNAEINALISKYDYIFKLKILEFYMGKTIKLN